MTANTNIHFVDTTLRDGNQSMWALLMSTKTMLPIASHINEAGYKAVELSAAAHFKTIVRELREDPWERIRLISRKMTDTPLAGMQQCNFSSFANDPKCLGCLWIQRLAANGIRRTHLMEPSNDFSSRLVDYVGFARQAGMEICLALIYSLSPKHTDEYYAQKTRDAVALNVNAIYLKDPGGLLTPERVKTLVPAILNNAGSIPVEFHSHCTTGLAPLCYLEAVRQGIRTLHVSIPPLAEGSAQPSVLNVTANLRYLGYNPVIDESKVRLVSQHLQFAAERGGHPVGQPVQYDYYQYIHQIPGGVISNLKRQLAQLKMIDKLPQVIEECIQVRKDFGYPIMVTPFSQFVATQAAINVALGERYKQVIDNLLNYALGFWGKEASSAIDLEVMDKLMAIPRAKELKNWEFPEPSLEEVRNQYGSGLSDDDLLLRYMIGNDDVIKAMRAAGPIKADDCISAEVPLRALVGELLKRRDVRSITLQTKGLRLALEQRS